MGWTRASSPNRRAVSWNTNPPIMAAMPSSQAGWRASRTMSRASNPAVGPVFRAPARWHTNAVAVHRAAATASKTALSISPRLQQARPPPKPADASAQADAVHHHRGGCS